jgi:hypothetical protein
MKKYFKKLSWRGFVHIRQGAPIIFGIVCFYCMAEIIAVLILPLILPKTFYLSLYLSSQAKEKTRMFLKNQNSLIPDTAAGWKNHPNFIRNNWIIDRHGSRATHEFTFQKQKSVRVMFLGSSMMNGGTSITNQETISAYLEDEKIEALNFGTMMYSLDQVVLAYQDQLYQFNADVIVVGIDIDPIEGLKNHYIPLRYPQEENVPYLKPRFYIDQDKLRLVNVSASRLLENVPKSNDLIEFLSKNDAFYYEFSTFCHMGMLPLSASIRHLYLKLRHFNRYFESDPQDEMLLKAVVREIELEAMSHHSKVIFLMNTDETTFLKSGIHKYLKDLYGQELNSLRSKGANIIDVRAVLRDSRIESDDLFAADHSHYSAMANQIIAEALKKEIHKEVGFNLN